MHPILSRLLCSVCLMSSLLSMAVPSPLTLLRRQDCTIAVDNNLFFHHHTNKPSKTSPAGGPADKPQPGLSGVWYKAPSMQRSHGRDRAENTLRLELTADGRPINLQVVPQACYFQIDRTHQEFTGDHVTLHQDITLFQDTVLGRFTIRNPKRQKLSLKLVSKAMNLGKVTVHSPQLIAVAITEEFHRGMTEAFSYDLPQATMTYGVSPIPPRPREWRSKQLTDRALFITHTSTALEEGQPELTFSVAIHVDRNAEKACVSAREATANPARFFQQATDQWNRFFTTQTPVLTCQDQLMRKFYYWSFYVLKADQYDRSGQALDSYICPSKFNDWLPLAWDEDTSHIVTGARWYNTPEALNMVQNMVLYFTRPGSPYNYGLITLAGWEVYLRTKDEDFLRKLYHNTLQRQKTYMKNMTGDLIHQHDSFLVGWDNSVRYAWGGFNKNLNHFERPIIPVDLNAYLVRECRLLAYMARHFGDSQKEREMTARADKVARLINQIMWDEKTGFYYDVFADDHTKLMVQPCSGFFPLLARIPTPEQAEKLGQTLLNPKKFNTPYAIPTIAQDYPKKGWGWSGSVCGRNNWLIAQGTANYSQKLTRHVVLKTIKLFTQNGNPRALGYQHPQRGGSYPPLFSTEIAGALDVFVRYYIGFEPLPDRQCSIFPAALPPDTEYLQWGPFNYQGRQVTIRYDNPLDGTDHFNDGTEGYTVLLDGKAIYTSKTIPTKPVILNIPAPQH